MRILSTLGIVLALLVGANFTIGAETGTPQEDAAKAKGAKPKYTLEQVMQDAHKGGLLKKIQSGEGARKDKLTLLDYYVAMYENKPEKGEAASWTKLTSQALAAAAKLVVDEKAKPEILKAATNCKACHDQHK